MKKYLNQTTISVAAVIVSIAAIVVSILLHNGPEPSFNISVVPIEISVQQGGRIPVNVNIVSLNGYSHSIYLSTLIKDAGITASFSIQSMIAEPSFTSIMTILVKRDIQPKKYTLEINGIGADGEKRNCSLILNVMPAPQFDPINLTDFFYPSGWMGDYEDIKLNDVFTGTFHTGNSCTKITYTAKGLPLNKNWAGIYWLYPDKNWGNFPESRDLTGARRITFWVKGQQGGEKAEFKTGGINGKYKDSMGGPYSTGVLKLTSDWKKFSIELDGYDLSHVIGGFCWVAAKALNPKGCTIYIDDILIE